MSKQEQTQKIEQEKNLKKGIHIYTLTHSHKSKAKFVTALVGHAYLSSQGTCALSRHYVPVRCNLLEPGQGARRSTDCTSHCRCGHPVVPPVPLAVREVQPVHFAPQYKTRYRFYRWVGWRYYFDKQKFPSCSGSENTHTSSSSYTRTHPLTHSHLYTP